jgi:transcriptional regulator GlxA family with amidase domain
MSPPSSPDLLSTSKGDVKGMDRRVQISIGFMKANLNREVLLIEIARLVNLSPSRLQHLFKAETGTPLTQYLKSLRLERARELLETTFLSVKQVMTTAGLKNKSHFVKDFRKAYGMTPTQYRRAITTYLAAENQTISSQTK